MPESDEFERNPSEDLKINRFSLELEAENQPAIYAYWSEQLSKAKKARDMQKNALAVLQAEKSRYFRDTLAKATVDAVRDAVTADAEVIFATNALSEGEYSVSILYATVGALEQKKSMLDNLTKLFIGQYFSKPTVHMGNSGDNINRTFNQNN